MKINFAAAILDLDGEPRRHQKENGALAPMTLSDVARNALLGRAANEELSGADHYHRYELAMKAKGESEWNAEDVALLKRLIAKAYAPAIVGPAYDLIESKKAT